MRRNLFSILSAFGAFFLCGVLYLGWVWYVEPFPDRDSINQFLFPFLNYLKASSSFDPPFAFLYPHTFSTSYPFGGALFPLLLSTLDFEGFFLKYPFALNLVLILLIALIPFFFRISPTKRFMLAILLFLIPATQICLKGFSLQAYNVLFALVAMLFLRSYMGMRNKGYLCGFIFFFWLCVIPKHLGAFYLANFGFAYLIFALLRRKADWWILGSFLLILLISLPFYPYQTLKNYLINVITHNPYLSVSSFFMIGSALGIIGGLLILLLSRSSLKKLPLPRLEKRSTLFFALLGFATYLTTVSYDAERGNVEVILFFLLGYGFLAYFLSKYEMGSTRGFFFLFLSLTYLNSTLLFCSMIGKTYYNFFLPILWVGMFAYLRADRVMIRSTLLCTCFLLSNFFPPILSMGKWFGEAGENIYVNGFNGVYINPLGWQKCEIPEIRKELKRRYSEVELGEKSIVSVVEKLHFHTKLSLAFPHNFFFSFPTIYRLDDLPPKELEELYEDFQREGIALFKRWLEEGEIPLMIIGKRAFTNLVGDPPGLEEMQAREEPGLNDFSRSLGFAFWKHLEKENLLNLYYEEFPIPDQNPRLILYRLRSLKKRVPENLWNHELSELATLYEMEQEREDLPGWTENLPPENLRRLRRKQAGSYYERANLLAEKEKFVEAYFLLRKTLEFDPTHVGGLEDALGLQEEFNDRDWKRVKEVYEPLSADELVKALRNAARVEESREAMVGLEGLSDQDRAHQFFILSNQFFDKDPQKCREMLEEALRLDPSHQEAKKDLEILRKKIQENPK